MLVRTKEKLAYLTALALLFSYMEMILPRPLPFLRFGFGNIALLLSFNLPFPHFLMLALLKACASSLVSGTLFSPFFLISLSQSFASGILMYLLASCNRKTGEKIFSVYGISICGSVLSAVVQIYSCAFYLGHGVFGLLGPMIVFNTLSGLATAFFASKINLEGILVPDENELPENELKSGQHVSHATLHLFFAIALLILIGSVFFIKNLYILIFVLAASLILQILCKRKIFILPHIFMWLFILLSSVFEPAGMVIFKIRRFAFTNEALNLAVLKSLRLSIVAALSQCAFLLKPPEKSILAMTLAFYKKMSDDFRSADGNILKKLGKVLKN